MEGRMEEMRGESDIRDPRQEDSQKAETSTDYAFRQIVKLVGSHEYVPGDRLYETLLTERLQMSRTPIREALGRLVAFGFLEKSVAKKGYLVPALTPLDMEQVFQGRALMESEALRWAMPNITKKDLENLRTWNRREEETYLEKDRAEYVDLNEKFHMTLAGFSQNPYLIPAIKNFYWRSMLYNIFLNSFTIATNFPEVSVRWGWKDHANILDAIEHRDSDEASRLMKDHIYSTYQIRRFPVTFLHKKDAFIPFC